MSRVVLYNGKVALAAGMGWRVFDRSAKKRARQADIRAAAADTESSMYCIVTGQTGSSLGLYQEDDDVPSKAGKLHSMAAVIAQAMGNVNAVVYWEINAQTAAVIVTEAGVPMVDKVEPINSAMQSVNGFLKGDQGHTDYEFFSNVADRMSEAKHLTDVQLLERATSAARLHQPPANVTQLMAVLMAVVVLGGGALGYQQWRAEQERQELLRKAREDDPTPKYRAELARRVGEMGFSAEALIALQDRLSAKSVWVSGWQLEQIVCKRDGACQASWARFGGNFEGLLAANPGQTLLADSTLDKARLQWNEKIALGGVGSVSAIPDREAARTRLFSVAQEWANAGITTTIAPSLSRWPASPGYDVAAVPPAEVVVAMPVKVSAPGALSNEVIRSTPPGVFFEEIQIDLKPAEARNSIRTTLAGQAYAR